MGESRTEFGHSILLYLDALRGEAKVDPLFKVNVAISILLSRDKHLACDYFPFLSLFYFSSLFSTGAVSYKQQVIFCLPYHFTDTMILNIFYI